MKTQSVTHRWAVWCGGEFLGTVRYTRLFKYWTFRPHGLQQPLPNQQNRMLMLDAIQRRAGKEIHMTIVTGCECCSGKGEVDMGELPNGSRVMQDCAVCGGRGVI